MDIYFSIAVCAQQKLVILVEADHQRAFMAGVPVRCIQRQVGFDGEIIHAHVGAAQFGGVIQGGPMVMTGRDDQLQPAGFSGE